MKLLSLTCPNCGANIEVNSELTMCTCNFCGKQFLVDDEYKRERKYNEQEGYDFENGRIRAQKEEAERIRQEQLRREAEIRHRQEREEQELAAIWNKNRGIYWIVLLVSGIFSFTVFFFEDSLQYLLLAGCVFGSVIAFVVDICRAASNGPFHNFYKRSYWVAGFFRGYVIGAIVHFIWFYMVYSKLLDRRRCGLYSNFS